MPYFSNDRAGSITGLDVSEYQGTTNFNTSYTAGARFLYIRTITSNPLRMDLNASANAIGGRAAGLKCGGYHLIRPDLTTLNSPLWEAERFANGLKDIFGSDPNNPYGDILPMIDVELPYPKPANITSDQMLNYIEIYINRLRYITGFRSVLFYTAKYFAESYNNLIHSKRGAIFSQYPLMLSAKDPSLYTGVNEPARGPYPSYGFETFGGWTKWLIWQYSLDTPDVQQGAIYGTTHPDVDVDALAPGFTLSALYNSSYTKIDTTLIGRKAPMPDATKFTDITIQGDIFMSNQGYNVVASPMLSIHREVLLNELQSGFVLIEGLPGKQIIIEKIQIYVDSAVNPTATSQLQLQTKEGTPKIIITTEATRLGTGAKINTDGFSYFTEVAANMRHRLPAGVSVECVPIVPVTAGAVTFTVYYRYV